jgi:hypothetical protein
MKATDQKPTSRGDPTMIRKNLLTVGLAAVLAVPAGIALAQTDDGMVEDETTVTTVAPDQIRDRQRLQDPETCDGTCPRADGETAIVQDQTQTRLRQRLHDPELCEADGDRVGRQLRLHATEDGRGRGGTAGFGPGGGRGPGDGTGPYHDDVVAEGGAGGTGYRGAVDGAGLQGAGQGDGTGPFHEEVVENGGRGGTGYRSGA